MNENAELLDRENLPRVRAPEGVRSGGGGGWRRGGGGRTEEEEEEEEEGMRRRDYNHMLQPQRNFISHIKTDSLSNPETSLPYRRSYPVPLPVPGIMLRQLFPYVWLWQLLLELKDRGLRVWISILKLKHFFKFNFQTVRSSAHCTSETNGPRCRRRIPTRASRICSAWPRSCRGPSRTWTACASAGRRCRSASRTSCWRSPSGDQSSTSGATGRKATRYSSTASTGSDGPDR